MSRKKKDHEKGKGRVLDVFVPPNGAGAAVGLIATTYTFDASFFEEQCVARFLSMETDAEEQGAAYLIEREEKLQNAHIAVVVDRANAGQSRSLAWDILSVRVPGGCMHAKVTLLVWTNAVRVVIGSANLTTPAYRSNLEVIGTLDFADGTGEAISLLHEVIAFLESLVRMSRELTPQARARELLLSTRERTRTWKAANKKRGAEPTVSLVFGGDVGHGKQSALQSLRENVWPGGRPPRAAYVCSPFFDEDASTAANAFTSVLAKRGEIETSLHLACTDQPDGGVLVQAPESLILALPHASIEPVVLEEDGEQRALHAKAYWLHNDQHCLYMIGSSNFTRAGLGIGSGPHNVEANLVYVAATDSDAAAALEACRPAAKTALGSQKRTYTRAFDKSDDGVDEASQLPMGFVEAIFDEIKGERFVLLRLDIDDLPKQFSVADSPSKTELIDSATWNRKATVRIAWPDVRPPTALDVTWTASTGLQHRAVWLVNVRDRLLLLPPDALRNLSLETLLDILTMSRPLYEAVLDALEREKNHSAGSANAELDPLRRFDSQNHLLKRTKRFARALETLRAQLELPIVIADALRAKLHGPVGPFALANAIERDGRDPGEFAFLLAEIALCLSRVRIADTPGCMPAALAREEIRLATRALEDRVSPTLVNVPLDVASYVNEAFAEATQ